MPLREQEQQPGKTPTPLSNLGTCKCFLQAIDNHIVVHWGQRDHDMVDDPGVFDSTSGAATWERPAISSDFGQMYNTRSVALHDTFISSLIHAFAHLFLRSFMLA
jgi:hypothetical protein